MMAFVTQLRLLPTLLVAACLLLVVKVGDVGVKANAVFSGVSAASAEATAAGASAPVSRPEAPAARPEAPAARDAGPRDPAPREASPAAAPADPAPAAAGTNPGAPTPAADPTAMSRGEVELLQELAERRAQLEERDRALDMREKLMTATEGRIDDKIAELKALKARIDELIKKHDESEDAQIASLVKVYESMKPKDAARIFDELDMGILIAVAERMKEAKMAAVLAEMSPPAAKALTVELATRNKLPATGG